MKHKYTFENYPHSAQADDAEGTESSHDIEHLVDDMCPDKELLYAKRLLDRSKRRAQKYDFLRNTEAEPAPKELYALWLYAYMANGGRVTHPRNREFTKPTEPEFSYRDSVVWIPMSEASQKIPTGYGASSMNILYLPDVTKLDVSPSSGDSRSGWEYGHSTLLTLSLDKRSKSGLSATTNNTVVVESFTDIDRLLESPEFRPKELVEMLRDAANQHNAEEFLTAIEATRLR